MINGDVKETELIIEGVKYKITSKRKKKVPSIDQVFSQKLKENLKKQVRSNIRFLILEIFSRTI